MLNYWCNKSQSRTYDAGIYVETTTTEHDFISWDAISLIEDANGWSMQGIIARCVSPVVQIMDLL